MIIRIKKIRILNFKGIKEFIHPLNGDHIYITGNNAVGKTTIIDAWLWLLFGKDSRDQADFVIKNYSSSNSTTDTVVNFVLDIDSKELDLEKRYVEKYDKEDKKVIGHTIEYYVNSVSVRKKDFQDKINSLANIDMLRLLTDANYFTDVLNWQKRREFLFDHFGDIEDKQIIESDDRFAILAEALDDKTIDEYKKEIKAKKRKISKALEEIPIRISEIERGSEISEEVDEEEIKEEIKKLEAEKEKISSNSAYLVEVNNEISKRQIRLNEIKNTLFSNIYEAIDKSNRLISKRENEIKQIEQKISDNEKRKEQANSELEKLTKTNYKKLEVCPVCLQKLPESWGKEDEESFNKKKAEDMKRLNNDIKVLTEDIGFLEKEKDKFSKMMEDDKNSRDLLNEQIEKLKGEDWFEKVETGLMITFLNQKMYDEFTMLKDELELLKTEVDRQRKGIDYTKVNELSSLIDEKKKLLILNENYKKMMQRKNELLDEERKLSNEFVKLNSTESLIDDFIKTKVDMTEKKINDEFALVNFKLFNQLLNGEIEQCCEITSKDGIPWKNLNSGFRINASIDIIETFSKKTGIYMPIMVDNAETVNDIINPKNNQKFIFKVTLDQTMKIQDKVI